MEPELIKKTHDKEIIGALVLSLLFMWSGFFLTYKTDPLNLTAQREKKEEALAAEQTKIAEIKKSFFGNLNLEAEAYVVYNTETGEIIASSNEGKTLPLASLTKVMTVLAASDELSPGSKVTVHQTGGELSGGLKSGENWQMANLAALTLVGSSNEGATALALAATSSEEALVSLMNQKAETLNLKSLRFSNPTGLDDGPLPGGQGSALDVAKLFTYVFKNKPELLTATKEGVLTEKSADGLSHSVVNTNTIINQIPGLIASKTGYTERAGGNLAVIANIGLHRPLVFVVIGSSKEGRFSDTKKLSEAALNYYASINK
ncbi:MAG: serine hydrolase [Candidatus Paceibacterota bacterium]|jgi:D-alanyl-D-alanine carboxypeptidase (penicillin-binding protein 5/6)